MVLIRVTWVKVKSEKHNCCGSLAVVEAVCTGAASTCTTEPKATIGGPSWQLWRKIVMKKQKQNRAHENTGTMRTTSISHQLLPSSWEWPTNEAWALHAGPAHTLSSGAQKMKANWQDLDLLQVWALPSANKASWHVSDTQKGCHKAQHPPITVRV